MRNILRVGLIVSAVVLVSGCCQKKKTSDSDPTPVTTTSAAAPTTAAPSGDFKWITNAATHTKFEAPPGWSQKLEGSWALFRAPDNKALLAYTTFDKPNESTHKLAEAAHLVGATGETWGSPNVGTIGVGKFPAHTGKSSCILGGLPNGRLNYATVTPGGPEQILIVYAVTADAPPNRDTEARVALDSLQSM